jgi:hypothetical protein
MAERANDAKLGAWWERHKGRAAGVYVFRVTDRAQLANLLEAAKVSEFFRHLRRALVDQLEERGMRCLCCQLELRGTPVAVAILADESDLDELISAAICAECCAIRDDRQIVERMAAPFNGVVIGRADQVGSNVHATHRTKQ